MKRRILILAAFACLLLSAESPRKTFQGEIDYDVSYESNQKTVDPTQLQIMFGVKEQFFISAAGYKSMTDGQLIEMQLYNPAANRLYTKVPESDTLIWFDAGINYDSVIQFSIDPNADTILGYPCQALSFSSKSGSSKYFFSNEFPIDPQPFRNHRFSNWAFVCEKTQALPLKMIIRNAQWTMTAVATVIRPMRLDSPFFKVPPGIQLQGRNQMGP